MKPVSLIKKYHDHGVTLYTKSICKLGYKVPKGFNIEAFKQKSACEQLVKVNALKEKYTPASQGQKSKTEFFINPKNFLYPQKSVASVKNLEGSEKDKIPTMATVTTLSTENQVIEKEIVFETDALEYEEGEI